MRSKTSWFSGTLYRKNMSRFWPIWGLYGIIWLFVLPLTLLNTYSPRFVEPGAGPYDGAWYFSNSYVLTTAGQPSTMLSIVFALLAAMAVFSYLYQAKSAGMLHALPVRREGLFLTNYLSGLSFILLPAAAVFLLTILAEVYAGVLSIGPLVLWLGTQVLSTLFFYSFAVFCAMFTGHILALPAFYGILNFLAIGVVSLLDYLLRQFVFGFNGISGMYNVASWLSPFLLLFQEVRSEYHYTFAPGGGNQLVSVTFSGMQYAVLFAAVGIVLALLALALYRRRHLESAGDVVSVRWVRPIFKYGMGICAALALGSFLYSMFSGSILQGVWGLLVFVVLSGAVGYFAAEMLLHKSFKVFGSWKGFLILAAVLAAGIGVMAFDLTGFEKRVPDAGRVVFAHLYGTNSSPYDTAGHANLELTDPEDIQAIVDLHGAIIAEGPTVDDNDRFSVSTEERHLASADTVDVDRARTVRVNVFYTLENDSEMSRTYTFMATEEGLKDPSSPEARLTKILNNPETLLKAYFGDPSQGRLMDVTITGYDSGEGSYQKAISGDGKEELLAAVKSDLAAGRIGIRYLLNDEARLTNCYYNDLTFTFQYAPEHKPEWANERETIQISITIQATATDTLAVLEKLGVLDTVELVTQAEMQRQDTDEKYDQ